jgi:hypothetical protein
MISSTWVTALRLFAKAWAKFLFASGKLSPANWDRVVLIYFGLFLVSISWLMHITSTYEEGARTDLTDAQLTLEKKKPSNKTFRNVDPTPQLPRPQRMVQTKLISQRLQNRAQVQRQSEKTEERPPSDTREATV